MKTRDSVIGILALLCCGLAVTSFNALQTEAQVGEFVQEPLKASELVESITVRIAVAEGEPLDEPLALDLGLGFPLWLSPVGRQEKDIVPFGAVPQTSTAASSVDPGQSVEFTFSPAADVGLDRFRTTQQLLRGVRVGDISRVGFLSRGEKAWILKGYSVYINNRRLAESSTVDLKPQALRGPAEFELAEIGLKANPLKEQVEDLRAIEKAGLATDGDRDELNLLSRQLDELTGRERWLRGQLSGRYPWYVESGWAPIGRQESSVRSVGVTLMTAPHPAADTHNVIYVQIGGHKYALSSADLPLTSAFGPQEFKLDLVSAPLTAADFRGFALGMLASAVPYAAAPDRWAPARLRVEVDDIVIYDSESYPFDQRSLAAVRLIPPVHLNEQGLPISNETHTARETFVWETGKAQGLDPTTGLAIVIPAPGNPGAPLPEPGATEVVPGEGVLPTPAVTPDEPPIAPTDEVADADFPPFPGETFPPQPQPIPPWPSPIPGPTPLNPWPLPPFQPWDDLPPTPIVPPQPTPQPTPAGHSPQVVDVRIQSGWRMNEPFSISWSVSGDESPVESYRVTLHTFHPDRTSPLGNELASTTAAAGQRTAMLNVLIPPDDEAHFFIPRVSLVPKQPRNTTPHLAFGPAKPVFPPDTDAVTDQLQIYPQTFRYVSAGETGVGNILFTGEPGYPGRAVWAIGKTESHLDFAFDAPSPGPGWNLVIRPQAGDQELSVGFLQHVAISPETPSRYRFVAYLGFARGGGADNQVHVSAQAVLSIAGGAQNNMPPIVTPPVTASCSATGTPLPMQRLELAIDPAEWELPTGSYPVTITVRTSGGTADKNHPPALFGVRWIRE